MSDFIFASKDKAAEILVKALQDIYVEDPPPAYVFRGDWGVLAVTQSHYHGFRPYENDLHLMVVIGGPVLYFRDNDFLVEEDTNTATEAIYHRWVVDGRVQWDEDLSGPFTIILIGKVDQSVTVITDLMAFIPVYHCGKEGDLYLGTHIDALAVVADRKDLYDQVSLADFILNNVVTYPFTAYENVRQLAPSSVISFRADSSHPQVFSYWVPNEYNPYSTIQEAAEALREGISGYIALVTSKMTNVAQFISGGEDSRALSGILPTRLQRDAFIFLDGMNREGRLAKKVAEVYGVNFNVGYRSATHYLEILPAAAKLVGSGHQFIHAHSLGFDKLFNLAGYSAVFGGYLSDSLLKSPFSRKVRGHDRFPFIPEISIPGESRTKPITSSIVDSAILDELNRRRTERFHAIKRERPATAHEWFVLRPATMRVAIPNLYSTRRLFRSYEPFMCKEAVKISAAAPTIWKLNRRLFNRAMKPYLHESKWLFHADGRLPYFGWCANMPLQFGVWLGRKVLQHAGFAKGNQGPWADWASNISSSQWTSMVDQCLESPVRLECWKDEMTVEKVLKSEQLTVSGKVNLMQIIYPLAMEK